MSIQNEVNMHAVEFKNLSRSDGSAIVSTGETAVQASVYGPFEIKVSKELCDKAVVEVSFISKVHSIDINERFIEYFIRNAVESVIITSMHPRTSISITIQEITNSGNLLACCVNAACLALLDAGIPMRGLVAATSIAFVDDKLVQFPSAKEIKNAQRISTVCLESSGQNIVGIKNSSFISSDELKKTIEVARKSCEDLFQFYRNACSKKYKKVETET
ncbi:exosome complex component RRP46-like [Argiope bruennichi]|uniref:exosome complex component RRP46-like n=1 Tax=Argiope bruennichi TaxID=94029 RepID=UPI0024940BBE|nr:exosome complex component RRP46-like [Argiope bruennichi]